jgi:hypothetical protein
MKIIEMLSDACSPRYRDLQIICTFWMLNLVLLSVWR